MEPQLPSPNVSPERPTTPAVEYGKNPYEQSESLLGSEKTVERQESRESQQSGPGDPRQTTPPPLPQIQQTQPVQQQTVQVTDDNPPTAADDDLIEKEWVEKAKKVIADTKHDPYLQEQAVSKLQADYLQKRYNKTVKVPDETA